MFELNPGKMAVLRTFKCALRTKMERSYPRSVGSDLGIFCVRFSQITESFNFEKKNEWLA